MKNIVLIGMMGCGKTTTGGVLAQMLGRELVDTDAYIEAKEGRTIPEIFDAEGETFFRDREKEVAVELAKRQDLIIACGGGMPMQPQCILALKGSGIVFWLDRDPGETYDSLDIANRPLARQGREDFVFKYAQRAPIYRAWTNHTVRAESAQAAADTIAAILSEGEQNA